MYEQVSHSLLNKILDRLKPDIRKRDLRHFYTRLGANFYAIYSLFHHLYGEREDFESQMVRLVEVMASQYIRRDDELKELDIAARAGPQLVPQPGMGRHGAVHRRLCRRPARD